MKYYCVAELEIIDQNWIPAYVRDVTRLLEQHGGKYLARTSNVEKLEGEREPPQVFLIVEWPSKEAALAFYRSAEYAPYLKNRLAGARNQLALVAGEDMTGAAQMAE